MKPYYFVAFLCCVACSSPSPPQKPAKPNILWIVAENFDLDFGCYGGQHVKTPYVDALAAAGMMYTNVFSTSPVCAPSRSAFMVGMYATTTDMHNMRSHREDDYRLPKGIRPITHRLKDVGYYTASISYIGEQEVGTGKLDLNFVNEGELYDTNDWSELKENQPFFAMINTPEAEYDIYDRKSAEKERVKWVGEEYHEQIAIPSEITPPPYYPDHQITREEWARYLNSVSGVDVRVGWIIKALKREKMFENTIVIFFSDNGRLEARGIHWLWDSGIHVPMIIKWPEAFEAPEGFIPGESVDEVISLLDLTATTLDMAGIDKPNGMQSQVFLGSNKETPRTYAFSARDRIDETVDRVRSVRSKRYHYIRNYMPGKGFPSLNRYKEKCFLVKPLMRQMMAEGTLSGPPLELMQAPPSEQLFDTEVDPFELNNLANSTDPKYQSILEEMRAALLAWENETGDLGANLEPDSLVASFEAEMIEWFGNPSWYQ